MTTLVMNSCSKDDDDSNVPDYIVGTWVMDGYYKGDDTHTVWFTYDEDGVTETTVTIKSNGKCSGKGMLINGDGDINVTTGNKWDEGYWAIIRFYNNGRKITKRFSRYHFRIENKKYEMRYIPETGRFLGKGEK